MYEKQFEHKGSEYFFCDLREKYVNQTALLLNSQWPRSLAQRHLNLRSLLDKSTTLSEKATLKIPVSLVLVSRKDDQVVGHASLVRIEAIFDQKAVKSEMSERQNQVFLESVLIHKDLRGIHLGKRLIQFCEEYFISFGKQLQEQAKESDNCDNERKLNCDYLHLNTKDKQQFYESIGYELIEPFTYYFVKTTRCTQIMSNLFAKMSNLSTNHEVASQTEEINRNDSEVPFQNYLQTKLSSQIPFPPPPPPPPNLCSDSASLSAFAKNESYSKIDKSQSANLSWYKKGFKSKI